MTRREYWTQVLMCLTWITFWYVSPIFFYLYVRHVSWLFIAGFVVLIYAARQFAYLAVVGFEELGHVTRLNRKTGKVVDAGLYWMWKFFPVLGWWNIHLGWSIVLQRVLNFKSFAGNTNHYVHHDDRNARHVAHSNGSFLTISTQRLVGRFLGWLFNLEDKERRIMYGKLAGFGYYLLCWPAAFICAYFGGWQSSASSAQPAGGGQHVVVSSQAVEPRPLTQQSPHKVRLSKNWPTEVPPKEYFLPGAGTYMANQIEYTLYEGGELFNWKQ